MLKLMKILRNWIPSIHEGPFEYSSEGFTKARRWAKNQDHPKFPGHPRLSL